VKKTWILPNQFYDFLENIYQFGLPPFLQSFLKELVGERKWQGYGGNTAGHVRSRGTLGEGDSSLSA